jgi:uncharacterized protein YdaU (DUF1376 family)
MARAWMPLYVADYLADTGHLSTIEHGAYMLLIMHYWQRGSLPKDDLRLSSIARASLEQWQGMKATLADMFDGDWTHKRIETELDRAKKAHEKRVLAGKRGGLSKASNAIAMLEQCSTNHNHNIKEREANASPKKKPKRATRIPDDWGPDASEAVRLGLPEQRIAFEADRFRDYWRGKSGKDATKADWLATWRNWCRTAVDNLPNQTPRATSPPRKFTVADMARKAMQEQTDEPDNQTGGHGIEGDFVADRPGAGIDGLVTNEGRR